MNKVTIISIIGAVVVIGGAIAFSASTNPSSTSLSKSAEVTVASEITVDREIHDFGEIDIFGGKVQSDFTLTNTGTEDVTITAATTSCGCTEGVVGGENFGMHSKLTAEVTIPVGETETLTAIYDPLAHGPNGTGQITRQLFLKTNSRTTPEIEVRISADVYKD